MAFSLKNIRIDGCKFGSPSPQDYRTVFKGGNIPSQVDLRPHCTPIEDQGALGSCTANAAVGALEYHIKKRQGRSVDLSRMFVYYNTRRLAGQVFVDSGAQIREAMAAVLAYGACPEAIWPYDPQQYTAEPPANAYKEALQYEGIQYARLAKGDSILQALAQGFPVVFGGAFPRCCYEDLKDGWVMPQPTTDQYQEQLRQGGGHAMLIVGYDQNERTYLVRNSWGQRWGRAGYCKMPFAVADMCSMDDEFWIVSELEKFAAGGHFTLVRPDSQHRAFAAAPAAAAPTPAAPPQKPTGSVADLAAKMREEIRSSLLADITSGRKEIADRFSRPAGPAAAQHDAPAPDQSRQGEPKLKGLCTACGGSGGCRVCRGVGCGYCSQGRCGSCNGHGVI